MDHFILIFMSGLLIGLAVGWLRLKHIRDSYDSLKQQYELLKATSEMQSDNKKLVDNLEEQLKSVSSSLLNQLYEKTEQHFQLKTDTINKLITPINMTISEFRKDILTFQTTQAEERGSLKSQITKLFEAEQKLERETSNLTNILKNPVTRGQWGEMQLRRVLELSGMLRYCDFNIQEQARESRVKPDAIIKLPDDKILVIDAKSPLSESYFSNDPDRSDLVIKIREHIKALKHKAYWEHFSSTPEFVILFLPGESLFNDALQHDPSLIDFGYESNVLLTSPVTLLAMLKTVSYAWKQENLHKQIEKIGIWGKRLYSRLSIMTKHLNKIGKNLNSAVTAYNETLGSLETRVLVSAREFEQFDVIEKEELLITPDMVEAVARNSLTKYETTDNDDELLQTIS